MSSAAGSKPAAYGGGVASVSATAGRADLFRALDLGGEAGLSAMAELLGYEERPGRRRDPAGGEAPHEARAPLPVPAAGDAPEADGGEGFLPLPFWRPVAAELSPEEELARALVPSASEPAVGEPRAADFDVPEEGVRRVPSPIVAWPRLWRVLDDRLRTASARAEIDVGELVSRWARGENVEPLPRLQGLVHSRVLIVLDYSPPLLGLRFDQLTLAGELVRRLGTASVRLVAVAGAEAEVPAAARDERVLALSDLGSYGRGRRAAFWERFGERLRRSGISALALVPCPPARWPRRAAELFSALEWSAPSRPTMGGAGMARRAPGGGPEAVELLLRLASPAIRLEAGLVRDLRRLVPGADVDTEVEMWRHAGVAARSRLGLRLDRDAVRRRLGLFRELPEAVQRAVIAALIDWHRTLAPEVLAEEVLGLIAHGVPESWIGPELVERVIELIAKLCRVVERGGAPEEEFPTACEAFLVRFGGRASRPVWSYPPLRPYLARAAKALRERRPESEPSAGATPEMFIPSGEELERWALWHEGAAIRIRALGETGEGSLLATISARRGELRAGDGVSPVRALDLAGERPEFPWPGGERTVEIVSDVESLRLELWQPPEWASAAGRDEHGLWISFEVGGVEQRLRWIPPGRFQMGSSDSEEGRFEREGPRHWVVLTEGFWLAETQCTQALWEAVMGEGENPSRFEDPRQPVERVSWEACQEFLDRLSFRIPGLEVRLPTEAEWEYACRAGTETPYWSGRQGGDLERVAWYRKNSEGRTHPVGEKPANPWGLHDMLGNVYEWCWDVWGPYEPRVAVDPEGPVHGAERVLRGGSWSDHARNVRAAYRGWFPPGDRDGYLGFRLSRGQGRGASVLDGIKRSSERVGRGTSPRRRSRRDRAWVERLGWASDGGADRFGRWASFEASGVSHRLRWIPSGRCLMGSPESEAGRWEAEGPRHEVSLSEGFWLGETPCTQALWEAVTGENPSRFRSRRRPVERVSWEDCQRFFAALNERVPDLRAGLPTEAQWEHACRAGTRTATWLGDLRILGERNAPLLDTIAWYGGNSGVGYELAEAEDCSEWSETQVPSTRAGTREVGRKHPNPWGLYDMLGNVWEWCSDYWADRYPSGPRIDPRGPEEGAGRVIRGGSWGARARGVRAACRDGDPPGGRGDSLGFRLSRGQGAPGMETESENKIQAGRKAWGRSPRDEA